MNGKELKDIKLPKELILAERRRANRLTIAAVLISNTLLFLLLNQDQPPEEKSRLPKDNISVISLEVQNYIPNEFSKNQKISLLKGKKLLVPKGELIRCQESKCILEIPTEKIIEILKTDPKQLKLVPRIVQQSRKISGRRAYEFTI